MLLFSETVAEESVETSCDHALKEMKDFIVTFSAF